MHLTFRKHILRFKQPAGTSRGVYHTRKAWYVTACDDDGHWGIGECAPLPDLSCDALPDAEYEALLSDFCHKTEQTQGAIPYEEARPYPSILFGLETAILSLQASIQRHNPYHLIDNAFSQGEKGIKINGLVWMGTYEEMMSRMEEKLSAGFRCIKIKIGAIDWEREINLIRALRQRFPKDVVEIRVDANGGFSPDIAMSRLQELARYDIHSIEQPIRQHQWQVMADLCKNTPIPIALDEELIGVNDPAEKIRLLDTIHPQYIILKPSLHGGLSGSDEWIRLARQRGIGYWATSALESNVGLNAIAQWALPHYSQGGSLPLADGEASLPQGLGTGQLFVENYDAIHLSIRGDALWCGSQKDIDFRSDYRTFLDEWNDSSDVVTVQTSGSTGMPKTMTVEKQRMKASARMTLSHLRLKTGDTALLCMPLHYIAGKMMVVRAIVGRLRLRLVTPSAHPLADLVAEKRWNMDRMSLPDFLALTPMQALATLEDDAERAIFESIPRIIIGGGAITPELHAALQGCRGEVYSTYGMTETLSHIAMRRLNGPEQSEYYTPLPGVTVSSSPDETLVVDAPAVNASRLVTNDLCEVRPDGTFKILGRRDNIICSGGIKLSLELLEQKLGNIGHPYLLTSVPDSHLGEALTLLYETTCEGPLSHESSATIERLMATISERLTGYEKPRHIYPVDHLPMTETGKPARAAARTMAEEIHKE